MSIIFLLLFTGVLMAFGYIVSTRLLRIQNPFAVTGMTWLLGEALYSMLVNVLGYVLPITTVFWVALVALVVPTIVLWRMSSVTVEQPPRVVRLGMWALALFVAVAFFRVTPSDPFSLIHYPVPATILEGNFPIQDPFNPWTSYGYHYMPMLLAAAVSGVTGVDLALSYALQSFLHAGTIVWFAAALGYVLLKSWKGALLVAVITVGGMGFHWWYVAPLLHDLYAAYVLGSPVNPAHETPLRYVSYMLGSARIQPIIATVIHRAIGMGSASFMAAIYAVYALVERHDRRSRLLWSAAIVVLTSVLALSLETTFVPLIGGMLAAAAFYGVTTYDKQAACWLVGVAAVCCVVAAVQGGVITSTLTLSGDTRPSTFELRPDGVYYFSETEGLALWSVEFLRDSGFPIFLFPLGVWLAWKRRKEQWIPLFIAGLAAMHMAVPFIIHYSARPHNMDRLWHIGISLCSFLLAWWLWETCIKNGSTLRRVFAAIVVVTTVLSTAMNVSIRMVFPDLEIGRTTFAPAMPNVSPAEAALEAWVRENTAPEDRLFYTQLSTYENPIHDPDFAIFVGNTGRFVVKRSFNDDAEVGKVATILAAEERCDSDALQALKIDYVVVRPGEQTEWFTKQCTPSLFEAVYSENGIYVYRFTL